jgi:endonuclease VIII
MPEGHTVHRSANDFNRLFGGQSLNVISPQGRFSDGAALISGHILVEASAVGKQLFLRFDNELTIRIHLGIYGKWRLHSLPSRDGESANGGAASDIPIVGEVRARFSNETALADLRGPTVCEVLNPSEVDLVLKRLGPDPINPDPRGAERERFAKKVLSSKTTIGQLLMNQAVVSGIGNVYRAELLFRAGINPYLPGNQLLPSQVDALWHDSVKLLKVGVKTGFMITRDELTKKRPTKAERNFVYKREGLPCRVCNQEVSIAIMATRKLYWCNGCQP